MRINAGGEKQPNGEFSAWEEMDLFRLERTERRPRRKQEGWDGGVLGPASCPPLISRLLICPPHPAGALAVPSSGLLAARLLETGRERKQRCYCPAEPVMGARPLLVPSCPSEEDLTLPDRSCVGKGSVGAGRRCVAGRWKKQEFGTNKIMGLSASSWARSLESCVFTYKFSTLCFHLWLSADTESTPDCCRSWHFLSCRGLWRLMEGTGFARGTSSLGLRPELSDLNHKGLWCVAQQKLEPRVLFWFGQVLHWSCEGL